MELYLPQSYQPALRARFELIRRRLNSIVPFAEIEHIGSSAVPGAESKGDLDVCVLVPISLLQGAVEILVANGYREQINTLRTSELCMLVMDEEGYEHAVQVVAKGSHGSDLFLKFRDLLRSNPKLVARYNSLKRETAPLGEEIYRQRKQEFIEGLLGTGGQAIDLGPDQGSRET